MTGPPGVHWRQVVSVSAYFSNPYVDWESRARDRDRLMAAFVAGDHVAFATLAQRYAATHVLRRVEASHPADANAPAGFERVFSSGTIAIFRRGGLTR